jgi:hypothetical protein
MPSEGAATSARKTAEKVSPACPEQHDGEQNPWAPPIPVGSEPSLLRKKHVGVRCYEAYDARGGPRPETEADLSAPNALSPIVAGPGDGRIHDGTHHTVDRDSRLHLCGPARFREDSVHALLSTTGITLLLPAVCVTCLTESVMW